MVNAKLSTFSFNVSSVQSIIGLSEDFVSLVEDPILDSLVEFVLKDTTSTLSDFAPELVLNVLDITMSQDSVHHVYQGILPSMASVVLLIKLFQELTALH